MFSRSYLCRSFDVEVVRLLFYLLEMCFFNIQEVVLGSWGVVESYLLMSWRWMCHLACRIFLSVRIPDYAVRIEDLYLSLNNVEVWQAHQFIPYKHRGCVLWPSVEVSVPLNYSSLQLQSRFKICPPPLHGDELWEYSCREGELAVFSDSL